MPGPGNVIGIFKNDQENDFIANVRNNSIVGLTVTETLESHLHLNVYGVLNSHKLKELSHFQDYLSTVLY